MKSKRVQQTPEQKEHFHKLETAVSKMDYADSTFSEEDVAMHTNDFAMIVDGDSDNPIENINNIKAGEPVHLLAYRVGDYCIGKPIMPAGTITFEEEKAARKFKESLLDGDKLANRNKIFLHQHANVLIKGKTLPNNIDVSHSNLVLDENTKIGGLVVRNSNIRLKEGSRVTHSYFYDTKTVSLDKTNKTSEAIEDAARIITKDSHITHCELGEDTCVLSSRLINSRISESILKKSYTNAFGPNYPLSSEPRKPNLTITESALTNSQIKAFSTEYDPELFNMTIDNSSLENAHIGTNNAFTTIKNADLSDFVFAESDSSINKITDATVSNLVLNKEAIIKNSVILNNTKEPVYANQRAYMTNAMLRFDKGYNLVQPDDNKIQLDQSSRLSDGLIESQPNHYNPFEDCPDIDLKPIGKKDNIFKSVFADIDYNDDESFDIDETSEFINSAINHSLETSKTKQVDDGIEL